MISQGPKAPLFFIINPASRGGRNREFLEKLEAWRSERCPDSIAVTTERPGHASDLAQQAAHRGYARLVSVGGDGTLGEVVDGIGRLPAEQRPALGVLSTGTGGDFARWLKEKYRADSNFSWLETARELPVDFGKIRLRAQGQERERCFLNIADVGLPGEVVRRVNATKKRLGTLEYLRATLPAVFKYRAPRVRVSILEPEAARRVWEIRLLLMVVANGRYFGGGMCIAPDAELDDQSFEILLAENLSYLSLLLELPKVYLKKKIRHRKVHYAQASRIQVESLDGLLPVDIDGDYFQAEAVSFELIPKGIRILIPI